MSLGVGSVRSNDRRGRPEGSIVLGKEEEEEDYRGENWQFYLT
jgi:hypothetical protein